MISVYVVTNDANDKAYVGACMVPLKERWKCHRSWAKHGRGYSLHKAMREIGVERFSIMRVFSGNGSRAQMKTLEEYFIKSFQTLVPNGYNETIGGTTRIFKPCPQERRKKISQSLMGHVISSETRAKISERTKIGMARRMAEKPWR